MYKLILRKFSYRFIGLMSAMYHGLTSAVKQYNGITPFFKSFVGWRQGCNLSPMLFSIFMKLSCNDGELQLELLVLCR